MALAEASPAECRGDVDLAKEAGLDLLRVHAHVGPPRDLRGRRRARDAAVAGLPAAVGLRPPDPSSRLCVRRARWSTCSATTRRSPCGAGTTSRCASTSTPATSRTPERSPVWVPGRWSSQQLPTWNKSVLDRSVKRAIESRRRHPARHRALGRHAPPPQLAGHRQPPLLRLVLRPRARPPRASRKAVPSQVRFPTEFGAQAVPDDRRLHRPDQLARPRLGPARHDPRPADSPSSTVTCRRDGPHLRVVEAGHAGVPGRPCVRHHIETLRRLKYRPTGGFAQFCFADGAPRRHLGRPRPRAAAEARPRRAGRRLPAGDRRGRPAARRGRARRCARPRRPRRVATGVSTSRAGSTPSCGWPGAGIDGRSRARYPPIPACGSAVDPVRDPGPSAGRRLDPPALRPRRRRRSQQRVLHDRSLTRLRR